MFSNICKLFVSSSQVLAAPHGVAPREAEEVDQRTLTEVEEAAQLAEEMEDYGELEHAVDRVLAEDAEDTS